MTAYDGCPVGTEPSDPVPLFLPLLRDGMDPVAELGQVRATRPIARLDVPEGVPLVGVFVDEEPETIESAWVATRRR